MNVLSNQVMLGIILVLLATLCLAIQNVNVKLVLSPQKLFGIWHTGGWLAATPDHAFLLLHLRTLWALPLLLITSVFLYPRSFSELKSLQFQNSNTRPLIWRSLVSAGLLFVALSSLFIAINYLPTGIAIAIFFIHPAEIVFLAWIGWGERPTPLQFTVVALMVAGLWLLPGHLEPEMSTQWMQGAGAALFASLTLSGHILLAQQCLRSPTQQPILHPVTFSLVLFSVGIGCSSLCLPFWSMQVHPSIWLTVIIMSSISGLASMLAYLLLNLGMQKIGASTSALISSLTPVLTAILAWVVLRETLSWLQMGGVGLISFSVVLLSLQHWQQQSS